MFAEYRNFILMQNDNSSLLSKCRVMTAKKGPEFGSYRQDLLTFLLENTKDFRPKKILFSKTFKTHLIVSRCFRLRSVKTLLKNQAIQCFLLF